MNEYKKQAEDFLTKTNTTLEVKRAEPQKSPLWHKDGETHGIHYSVTLENNNAKYTFDFWDSIKNAECLEMIEKYSDERNTGQKQRLIEILKAEDIIIGQYTPKKTIMEKIDGVFTPNAYSVLTCLDLLHEKSFQDFCDSFGYESDSRTAEKTYNAVMEQDRNLRKLFDRSELELLQEIQ